MHAPRRLTASFSAASPAALVVAVLALILAGAGAGYSAAKIGTKDIKNNAVTSAKVKNGTLKNADLVREKKYTKISASGAPDFSNGGEGDCVWTDAAALIPGLSAPSFRVDRFGTVHLAGIVQRVNGPGGDATCDPSAVGETEDGIVMVLPSRLRPGKTQIRFQGLSGDAIIIVGPNGLVSGPTALPAGAVYVSGSGAIFDGITYEAAGTHLAARTATRSHGGPAGRALLRQLGLG